MDAHTRNTKKEQAASLLYKIRMSKGAIQSLANDPTQPDYNKKVQALRDEIAQLEEQRKAIKRELLQDELDNL